LVPNRNEVGLIFALLTASCQTRAQPAVIIDDWGIIHHAKSSCKEANDCGSNPANPGGVADYIHALKSQFASSVDCQGVLIFNIEGPSIVQQKKPPEAAVQLIVNFVPNSPTQSYSTMVKSASGIYGAGIMSSIVKRSCLAARKISG
jgi:hypothetical protein